MASIQPGFEYDIFISYRHKDNRNGGITEFVDLLKKELEATFKEDLSIYFDSNAHDGLLENHDVDKSLEGKLKCLIFIPIISQTYCDTKSFAWQHEFCAFNKMAKEDQLGRDIKLSNGNVASRILPIKVHDLDIEDMTIIETEIGGILRPIEFIYKEPGVNRPLKITDKKEDNQNHTDYSNQLNKVANAIKEIIYAIKHPQANVTTSVTGSPKRESVKTTAPTSRNKNAIIGALASIVIAAVAFFTYQKLNTKLSTNNDTTDKSIAVLPFADMSPDKDQEYFSDGISEELLNLLAKIPDLKVIARTSAFAFKGKNEDLREIGEKLGVAHILEGSVRKSGNTLRITAQLIKASDGAHLWSETYDRTLDDIFKVQDEIAAQVVQQLKIKLMGSNAPVAATMKPEAYNLYMEGRYFGSRINKANLEKAEAKFKEALAIDPNAAQLWAGFASNYSNQAALNYRPVEEGVRLAKKAVEKALDLDPNNAQAYSIRGFIHHTFENDIDNAESELKKAMGLDPQNPALIANYATFLGKLGRVDEAIELCDKTIAMDPLRPNIHAFLGIMYQRKGDWKKAAESFYKASELHPDRPLIFYQLFISEMHSGNPKAALQALEREQDETWKTCGLPIVYFALGRKTEAEASFRELIEKYSEDSAYQIAQVYAFIGETNKAFEWLERAYQQKDPGLIDLHIDQFFKNLHNESRWSEIEKKASEMKL